MTKIKCNLDFGLTADQASHKKNNKFVRYINRKYPK